MILCGLRMEFINRWDANRDFEYGVASYLVTFPLTDSLNSASKTAPDVLAASRSFISCNWAFFPAIIWASSILASLTSLVVRSFEASNHIAGSRRIAMFLLLVDTEASILFN